MSNETVIRAAFEDALVKGLKGEPLTNKEGEPVTDPVSGALLLSAPEASFLSVVRAYLKDLIGTADPKVPQTGKPRDGGLLDQFQKSKLPFGIRPQ